MTVVHKFQLHHGTTMHSLPAGAKVLHVHEQSGLMFIWVELDPDSVVRTSRRFEVVATGENMPLRHQQYIGTIHPDGGWLVFHVYEVFQ